MRICILVVPLLVVGSSAYAQSQDSSRPGLGYVAAQVETQNRNHLSPSSERTECLVRKSDGKRVCNTRAEWRKIAEQLAKAEEQPR